MKISKNCSVFGHRDIEITPELEEKLYTTFKKLIGEGCVNFYFGGFGMFDWLCHKVITRLKQQYTYINRIYCLSDERYLKISKRPKVLKNEDYEEFVYLPLVNDWWYKRIYFRNCAMIDLSDIVVFYVINKENSGAYKAMNYAKRVKKEYINLADC